MKTPMSEKSVETIAAIESFFPGTIQAITDNKCPVCRNPIGLFKDKLSEKEYEISGMCQHCQDLAFSCDDRMF